MRSMQYSKVEEASLQEARHLPEKALRGKNDDHKYFGLARSRDPALGTETATPNLFLDFASKASLRLHGTARLQLTRDNKWS